MPRLTYKDVFLFIPRKCFRYRTIVVWVCIGFLMFISLLSMILHYGLSEENVNWAIRGVPLRDLPYGRSGGNDQLLSKQNLFEFDTDHARSRRKLERNKQPPVDAAGGNNSDTAETIIRSINIASKTPQASSKLKFRSSASLTSTELAPGILANFSVKGILNSTPDSKSHLGCEEIATLKLTRRVGRGTTKDVYSSVYRGEQVAVKMVSPKVQDIKACLRRKMFRDKEECFVYANYKIMKEIALAQQLQHPNIVELIGYCIQSHPLFNREKDHGVISVVEFGAKASLNRLSGLNWQQRLEAAISLADLLDYLEHSPVGSLAIWDFKHSQFVMTDDYKIKYSDLDDLSADEPVCETEDDCAIPKSNRIRVNCTHSQCHGFNAKFNLLRTAKEFLKPLLDDSPPECQKQLHEMFKKLTKLEIEASEVKRILTEIKNRNTKDKGL